MDNTNQKGKADVAKARLKAINANRGGLVPKSVVFALTNDDLEKFLYKTFEENGVEVNDENFYVKVLWNHKYDQIIKRRERASDVLPIVVHVVKRFTKEDLNGGNNGGMTHSNIRSVENVLLEIQRNGMRDDQQSAQASIIADTKMAAVINSFTNKAPKWRCLVKKRNLWGCQLDPKMVLAAFFDIEDTNFPFILDFVDVKEYTTRAEDGKHFMTTVSKAFANQTYKNSKKNKFKGLF